MERGSEQLPPRREELRSFDLMASFDMMRFDLITAGLVRPETRQRVYDEELTYVAENMNRPIVTEFRLRSEAGELMYFDRGQWRPYVGTLIQGLEVAKAEARQDYRRAFLVERAAYDLEIGYKLKNLRPGEKISWDSPFPEKEFYAFGGEFLRECGFQTDRWMGFIYQAEKAWDGSVTLHSQSVDNSDPEAFEAARAYAAAHPECSMNQLLKVFDAVLSQKHEQAFSAGRPQANEVNAWEFIAAQKDLVEHYINRLEEMARSDDRSERAKKELTYGFWAALKDRLNNTTKLQVSQIRGYDDPSLQYRMLSQEMNQSFQSAVMRNERLVGCGGMLKMSSSGPEAAPGESLLDMSPEDAMKSIMSDKPEKLVWKMGICRIEGCPTRPSKTQVAQCQVCRKCQHLFDQGKDPIKLYKYRAKVA